MPYSPHPAPPHPLTTERESLETAPAPLAQLDSLTWAHSLLLLSLLLIIINQSLFKYQSNKQYLQF